MPLEIINLTAAAGRVGRPFAVLALASVGELALSVYICQGQVDWHRHPDEDELFLVHEGTMTLETERGRLTLHAEELVVVPKGLAHRSGSTLRSVVLLLRPAMLTTRRNGHRQAYGLDGDPPLEKVRLARVGAALPPLNVATTVARVEDFNVQLARMEGELPPMTAPAAGGLWHVLRGSLEITPEAGAAQALQAGEVVVIPRGAAYRLTAREPALALTLARD